MKVNVLLETNIDSGKYKNQLYIDFMHEKIAEIVFVNYINTLKQGMQDYIDDGETFNGTLADWATIFTDPDAFKDTIKEDIEKVADVIVNKVKEKFDAWLKENRQ